MTIVWDEWEDGYEANALNPTQSTPKYGVMVILTMVLLRVIQVILFLPGGNIVLDNTMNANPRNPASIIMMVKIK